MGDSSGGQTPREGGGTVPSLKAQTEQLQSLLAPVGTIAEL